VTELATRVALHGLSLAIAGKVVRTTALVASSRARTAGETTTAAIGTRVATAAGDGSTSAQSTGTNGVGAGALGGYVSSSSDAVLFGFVCLQPSGRAGRSYSSVHWRQFH
jgi:hypothetical protein